MYCQCPPVAPAVATTMTQMLGTAWTKRVIRVLRPIAVNELFVRLRIVISDWRRSALASYPGRWPFSPRFQRGPCKSLAAARGSIRCAEPRPLPTLSASAAFFRVCCRPLCTASSTSSVSFQRFSLLEPIALHVHPSRLAFALRRTRHTQDESQRCQNCAPGTEHYSRSCNGESLNHPEAKYLSWPDGRHLPLSRFRHEPPGFPDVRLLPW